MNSAFTLAANVPSAVNKAREIVHFIKWYFSCLTKKIFAVPHIRNLNQLPILEGISIIEVYNEVGERTYEERYRALKKPFHEKKEAKKCLGLYVQFREIT